MKRKPKHGICSVCGAAVPTTQSHLAVDLDYKCIDGHYYKLGKLETVRCSQHMDEKDPRSPGYGWS